MRWIVGDSLRIRGINIGIVEESQAEFGGENTRDRAIQLALRNAAVFHLLEDRAKYRAVREIVVHASSERLARGVGLIRSDVVDLVEHLQAVAVGRYVAVEAPLLPQHAIQQPLIHVRRNAVNFVVGGHHAAGARLPNRSFKRVQIKFAQLALREIGGRSVGTAFRLAVRGEVFGGGQNVVPVDEIGISLQAFDGGDADARTEIRVLAIRFFRAAPARVAREIEYRREGLIVAGGSHLVGGRGENFLYQCGIPRAGQTNGLRKARAAVRHEAVQRFALKERWNAESSLFKLIPLQCVVSQSAHARRHLVVEAIPFLEDFVGYFVRELAGGVDEAGAVAVASSDLLHLLFESHPREQVRDAVRYRFGLVFIKRLLLREEWRSANHECCEKNSSEAIHCGIHG